MGREICQLGLCKGPKHELTDEFYGFIKSRKRSIVVIDSYLKDSAFTAVKRDARLNKVCERGSVPFVNTMFAKGVPFS